MNQIMKSFLGIFLMLFMTASCIGIFGAFLDVMQAQNMHASIIRELENSAFYPEVIRQCYEKAEERGYDLTITLYEKNSAEREIHGIEEIPFDTSYCAGGLVQLAFQIEIPLFSADEAHLLTGYAR